MYWYFNADGGYGADIINIKSSVPSTLYVSRDDHADYATIVVPSFTGTIQSAASFGNYIMVNNQFNTIYYTLDGINWTSYDFWTKISGHTRESGEALKNVYYTGSHYIAVASNVNRPTNYFYSTDLINWVWITHANTRYENGGIETFNQSAQVVTNTFRPVLISATGQTTVICRDAFKTTLKYAATVAGPFTSMDLTNGSTRVWGLISRGAGRWSVVLSNGFLYETEDNWATFTRKIYDGPESRVVSVGYDRDTGTTLLSSTNSGETVFRLHRRVGDTAPFVNVTPPNWTASTPVYNGGRVWIGHAGGPTAISHNGFWYSTTYGETWSLRTKAVLPNGDNSPTSYPRRALNTNTDGGIGTY